MPRKRKGVLHARDRLWQLARAQEPPERIAATLMREYGGELLTIGEYLAQEPLRQHIAAEAARGRALLNIKNYEHALSETSTQATSLSVHLAASHVDDAARRKVRELRKMSPAKKRELLQDISKQIGPAEEEP